MAIILSFSLLYRLIKVVRMMCELPVGLNVEERLHGGWMDAVMTGRRRLDRLRERLLAPVFGFRLRGPRKREDRFRFWGPILCWIGAAGPPTGNGGPFPFTVWGRWLAPASARLF